MREVKGRRKTPFYTFPTPFFNMSSVLILGLGPARGTILLFAEKRERGKTSFSEIKVARNKVLSLLTEN